MYVGGWVLCVQACVSVCIAYMWCVCVVSLSGGVVWVSWRDMGYLDWYPQPDFCKWKFYLKWVFELTATWPVDYKISSPPNHCTLCRDLISLYWYLFNSLRMQPVKWQMKWQDPDHWGKKSFRTFRSLWNLKRTPCRSDSWGYENDLTDTSWYQWLVHPWVGNSDSCTTFQILSFDNNDFYDFKADLFIDRRI